jgi:membrane fusion protein (multidrug efflux system)
LSAGTGNVFSLLPAQNATGNWIKVVQRLPVRVNLNQAEITRHPLRLGLSATAVVDVHDQHGKTLATAPVTAYQTLEYQQNDVPVEQLITHIVRQNSGT